MVAGDRRLVVYVIGAAVGAAILVVLLPSLLLQAVVVVGAWAMSMSLLLVRLGRSLDPAWVVVTAVYLLGPVGALLLEFGIGLPTLAGMALGFAPFVIAAAWVRPLSRDQVLRLTPLLILAILGGASLLWSSDRAYGAEKLSIWLFTGLLPAIFVIVLTSAARRVTWSIILSAALISSVAYLVFATPTPEFPDQPVLLGGNPIWAARAAYIGALVALFGPFPRWLPLLVVPIFVMNGLLTQSLGPAVGFLVGAFAGVVEALRRADPHHRLVPVGWATLGLGAGIAMLVLVSGILGPVLGSLIDDPNVGSRASYLDLTQRAFLSAPVLGEGIGSFASMGADQYPHNLAAEVGSELGIFGLLALGAWVVVAFRGALGSPILVALVVATGLFSLFSGSIASNTEFWLFSALAVGMLAVRREEATEPPGAGLSAPWIPPRLSVARPGRLNPHDRAPGAERD